ncbi:MAG TPA: rhomboid family intramembrane serine protease [Nocardioidaceae bacterium]|nr:rhomboid family intramembrane serine protease [Nocardioidaceae bacterium]
MSEGAKSTRSGRTAFGGNVPGNPALTSQVLIAINAAVWLLILVTGGQSSRWFDRLALRADGGEVRVPDGRIFLVPDGVMDGAWWQLVTSMFTHVSLLHIGFNMVALWLFGPQLEQLFGRMRYLAIYFLSGLAGSAVVYGFSEPLAATAGASGAIFGLFGAYFVVALKTRRDVKQMLLLLGVNAFITFSVPNISWQGHVGGFVGGALIAAILVYAPREHRTRWQIAGLAGVGVLLLVALATRTLVLA